MGAKEAGIVVCSGWWEAPPPGWGRARVRVRVYLKEIDGAIVSDTVGEIVGDIVSAPPATAR